MHGTCKQLAVCLTTARIGHVFTTCCMPMSVLLTGKVVQVQHAVQMAHLQVAFTGFCPLHEACVKGKQNSHCSEGKNHFYVSRHNRT